MVERGAGSYGWSSVHCGDYQGKESSGNNLTGNFLVGFFIERFKSFYNSANHSTKLKPFK